MIRHVVRLHENIRGTTPEGIVYHANDPRLLDWVQATASFGFIEAYHRYVTPLSDADRSRAFAEGAVAADLYGAAGAPTSLAGWHRTLAATEPVLVKSDIVFEFLDIMNSAPILPRALRPVQRMLVAAAIDLVPHAVRARLGLKRVNLSRVGRALVGVMGHFADRIPLAAAPPAQACQRLGLPLDYLYR